MELGTRDTLLTVASAVLMLAGIGLVLVQNATMTIVGIVLIVASTLVFVVDAKDLLVKTDRNAGETRE